MTVLSLPTTRRSVETTQPPSSHLRHPARAFAWVVAAILVVLCVHWATTWSMVLTWSRSNTYTHGFIVFPVVLGWLWLRRAALAALPVRPSWWGLVGLALLSVVWRVFDAVGANAPSQFVVIAMVPAFIATVLGGAWVRALQFPLLFLFFAVPAGDVLIPYLTEWTADFVMASLQLLGIPVFREADQLLISSGLWKVKESCSGIRYLMACATLGTIYAAMTYRSPRKQLLFIAALVVFAVVANWLRALGVVMLAHFTNNQLAVGVDHLIYGWVFFGLVLVTAFGVGSRWRDAPQPPLAPGVQPSAWPQTPARRGLVAAVVASLAVFMVNPLHATLASPRTHGPAGSLTFEPNAGWTSVDASKPVWRPQVVNATLEQSRVFERAGSRVGIFAAAYVNSTREAKLVSSSNRLIAEDDAKWNVVDRGTATAVLGADPIEMPTAVVAGPSGRVVVWQLFWVNGIATGSRTRAAFEDLTNRLLGRDCTSVWLLVYTAESGSGPTALAQFMHDMGPSMDRVLRELADRR